MSRGDATAPVVIVGAGQAGVQAADSLREGGYPGPVVLLGDEPGAPYHRPPLSKDFLVADDPRPLPLRGERFLAERGIDHRPGAVVTGVDRARRTVVLGSGREIGYEVLVLATGAEPRRPSFPGTELRGVVALRTLADAAVLRTELVRARSIVVVGAGFVGLEVAAAARRRGVGVTVLESAGRVLGRAVSPETGRHLLRAHGAMGTRLFLDNGPTGLAGTDGAISAAVDARGGRHSADLVVLGIGVRPRDDLAHDCGLEVDDGIVVDEHLRTADPAIFAIGDCARFPAAPGGPSLRLESVQNATDQARHVAQVILGAATAPYARVPWFWSVQGPTSLQIAGLARPGDAEVVCGDVAGGAFSVLRFRDDRLVAVESVNRPADHAAARRVLAGADLPTPDQVTAPGFSLKEHVTRQRATSRGAS